MHRSGRDLAKGLSQTRSRSISTDVEKGTLIGFVAGTLGVVAGVAGAIAGWAFAGLIAAAACATCAGVFAISIGRAAEEIAAAKEDARLKEAQHRANAAADERAAAEIVADQRRQESIVDVQSGLLDHRVFAVTFERKIAAARRHLRPLSLVLIDLSPGLPEDDAARDQALNRWGAVLSQTLRESDIACRVGESTVGIICEDTAEAGGVWVAERVQIGAASAGVRLGPVRAAVATYPNHGLRADEVLGRAWSALERARTPVGDGSERFAPVELPNPES
jgi:diguanylate cyclase (GGDEF)-like protein